MGSHLRYDWYGGEVPSNIEVGEDSYIDTTYGLAAFLSRRRPGLVLGRAAGLYNRASLVVGPLGRIDIGAYSCLNGTYLVCEERIEIGAHCLLSWGVTVTDHWLGACVPVEKRRAVLERAAADPDRRLTAVAAPAPVALEDNVWVGFDAVVLPGTRLGRGCIVGCKSVVDRDIPPYAVAVGDPVRVVRYLEPDDTPATRRQALSEYAR